MKKLHNQIAFCVCVLGIALAGMLVSRSVHASIGLQITPATEDIGIVPGSTIARELRIKNIGDANQRFVVDVRGVEFVGVGDGKQLRFIEGAAKDPKQLAAWITVEQQEITLAPEESQAIQYTIATPDSAEEVLQYAGLFFVTTAESATDIGNEVAVGGHIGMIIRAGASNAISGQAAGDVRVTDFNMGRRLLFYWPVAVSIEIENNEDGIVVPAGAVTIFRGDALVGEAAINPDGIAIDPHSKRRFIVDEIYGHRYGRFEARYGVPNVAQGEGDTIIFWVIPPWTIAAASAGLVLIVIGIIVWMQRRRQKKKKQNAREKEASAR